MGHLLLIETVRQLEVGTCSIMGSHQSSFVLHSITYIEQAANFSLKNDFFGRVVLLCLSVVLLIVLPCLL